VLLSTTAGIGPLHIALALVKGPDRAGLGARGVGKLDAARNNQEQLPAQL